MIHYILNTGTIEDEPRRNVSDKVLRILTPMYEPGTHPLPVMGYRAEVIEICAGSFCLVIDERKDLPLISVAVAEGSIAAEELWPELVRFYEVMKSWNGTAPVSTASVLRPTPAPWYATMEIFSDPGDAGLLRDFSRHFAWGWVDCQRWCDVLRRRRRFW